MIASGVAAVGAACVAYGTFIERRWYRLATVEIPGVLRRDGSLRVLHISDIHLVPTQQHRIDFLARVAEEDYDLVVATGDLLGAVGAEDAAVAALAPLTRDGRPGLVVLGSNDFFGPVVKSPLRYFFDDGRPSTHDPAHRLDTERLIDGLAAHGYRTLRNAATTVTTSAGTVAVGGIDDPHLADTRIPPIAALRPTVADAVLHLGLVHAPYREALDRLVDAGHDLLLAGHTHGGQVRLPGIGALVNNCDLPLRQTRGASRYRDRWLHVSVGLGHSRYAPFRFACRPEATILLLTG
ncbi:MAG: metallophosphoesterase [Nitriliruptoraceae bacterium]